MRRSRFNIANLVAIIFILGVGFAALREATDLWDSSIFSLTLGVLLISILLAIHRSENRRAFWLGFAVFGWVYLGLALIPSIESRLITTKALAYLDSKVPRRSSKVFIYLLSNIRSRSPSTKAPNLAFTPDGKQITATSQGQVRLWDVRTGRLLGGWGGTTENFVRIGHSLFALLVGWFGGQLSRRLSRTSSVSEPSTAVDGEGTDS
jgi:hypothetical protein